MLEYIIGTWKQNHFKNYYWLKKYVLGCLLVEGTESLQPRTYLFNQILTAKPVRRANMHHCAKFRVDCVNRCRDMTVFWIFKMAEDCHFGFWKVRNFNYARPVRRANMHYQAKFRADRSNCGRVFWHFGHFAIPPVLLWRRSRRWCLQKVMMVSNSRMLTSKCLKAHSHRALLRPSRPSRDERRVRRRTYRRASTPR